MIKMVTDIKRRDSFLHCPLHGLTWKVSFCTWCFWKATWRPTAKREKTYKFSSVMKKQLVITEEPLSPPDYSLSGESFISEVVKGQVQSSDSLHLGLKSDTPNAQSISAWTLSIFSRVFDLASDTAMASRWGLKLTPVFIQSNRLWISHSVSVEKDLIHWPWGPSGSLNLQCSGVNIATVLVPSPFKVSVAPEVFHLDSFRFSGSGQSTFVN